MAYIRQLLIQTKNILYSVANRQGKQDALKKYFIQISKKNKNAVKSFLEEKFSHETNHSVVCMFDSIARFFLNPEAIFDLRIILLKYAEDCHFYGCGCFYDHLKNTKPKTDNLNLTIQKSMIHTVK